MLSRKYILYVRAPPCVKEKENTFVERRVLCVYIYICAYGGPAEKDVRWILFDIDLSPFFLFSLSPSLSRSLLPYPLRSHTHAHPLPSSSSSSPPPPSPSSPPNRVILLSSPKAHARPRTRVHNIYTISYIIRHVYSPHRSPPFWTGKPVENVSPLEIFWHH